MEFDHSDISNLLQKSKALGKKLIVVIEIICFCYSLSLMIKGPYLSFA